MIRIEPNPAVRNYIQQFQLQAKKQCAPLFWEDNNGKLTGGTMTFLRTEIKVLGLTNAHVAKEILNHIKESSNVIQLGGARFDADRLVEIHPEADLATFDASDILMATAGEHFAASVREWPIEKPNGKDVLLAGGWPGIGRNRRPDGSIDADFSFVATRINDEPGRYISLNFDLENSTALSPRAMPKGYDLGGWSGGGVYRYRGEEQGYQIEYIELCGIISDALESSAVLAHDLTSLNPDGTFNS